MLYVGWLKRVNHVLVMLSEAFGDPDLQSKICSEGDITAELPLIPQ